MTGDPWKTSARLSMQRLLGLTPPFRNASWIASVMHEPPANEVIESNLITVKGCPPNAVFS